MTTLTAQPAIAARRRFDGGSRLALSVVVLVAAASLAATFAVMSRPGDGCILNPGADAVQILACVGGWPTPLRAGDEVIAVDGIPQVQGVSIRQPPAPAGWVDGGISHYVVKRGADTLDLEVPLHGMSWDGMLRALGYGLAMQAPYWHFVALIGAIIIFVLRPRARAAQLLLVALGGLTAVTALTAPANSIGVSFAPAPLWNVGLFLNLCWAWLFAPTLLVLILSFPNRVGPLAVRPRQTLALIYGLPLAAIAASFATGEAVYYLIALGLGALSLLVATVAVTLHTFLRVRDPVIRAQTGWLALGIAVGLAWWPTVFVLGFVFPGLEQAIEQLPWWLWMIQLVPIVAFPLCLGIAITRYRLFDLDLVVNRALVYGALTGCVIGLYILVVGYLGWLFRVRDNLVLSLVATGIVAVAFAPLRSLLQRGVNRLMYGDRDEPYRVLTRLGRQLENSVQQSAALALTVETVARALKLPYVAVALKRGGNLETLAAYGSADHETIRVPLVYAGESIGELVAARRAPHEELTAADRRLLHDLARQIGVAAHAVALAADLEQARLRLVTERGEARRRLGSDLHDGVGHQLAGLTRHVERAARAVTDDPELASAATSFYEVAAKLAPPLHTCPRC